MVRVAAALALTLLAVGCGRSGPDHDRSAEAIAVCESAIAQRLATDPTKLSFDSSASRLGSSAWDVTGVVTKQPSPPVAFTCGVYRDGADKDAPLRTDGVIVPTGPTSSPKALTHDEYQRAILKILESEDTRAAGRLFTDTVANDYSSGECAKRVQALHDHLQAIVDAAAALNAPADAAESQRTFVREANESVRLVGVAAVDVGKGDLPCGMPLNRRIYGMPSTKRAQAALAILEKRGYFIFGN